MHVRKDGYRVKRIGWCDRGASARERCSTEMAGACVVGELKGGVATWRLRTYLFAHRPCSYLAAAYLYRSAALMHAIIPPILSGGTSLRIILQHDAPGRPRLHHLPTATACRSLRPCSKSRRPYRRLEQRERRS